MSQNQTSLKKDQTSKENNKCSKNRCNSRTNEHLCITIGANILKKETESKSRRTDPDPENPKQSKSKRPGPYPEKPKKSKSNSPDPYPWKEPTSKFWKPNYPDPENPVKSNDPNNR